MPELLILSMVSLFIVRRLEISHIAVFIGLVGGLVLLVMAYPPYYISPITERAKTSYLALVSIPNGITAFLKIYLISIFRHRFIEYLFFVHISFIIVISFELATQNANKIETFSAAKNVLAKTKFPTFASRRKRGESMNDKTTIGFCRRREVFIPDNARHIMVCGTTGSGKTTALYNFVKSAYEKNYPLVFVDGKGDIGIGSILEMVQDIGRKYPNRKTYVINMADVENSDFYNPFQESSATIVRDMLINLTDWSEEHYKANTERYVQLLVNLMELLGIPLNLDNLLKHFPEDILKNLSADAEKDGLITKSEHLYNLGIIKASSDIAEKASARFSTIKESEIGKILSANGVDIFHAIKEKATILFVLNSLSYPELAKAFGRLIIIDAKKSVSKMYTKRMSRSFFIFDELGTYASETITNLINKSRSADVTCICSVQSLSDLEAVSETFREQIIENCNNYIVLRQNSGANAEAWANTFGTSEKLSITYQLGNDANNMSATGRGSARKVREYIYHPDVIKTLKTGEAIYLSRDFGEHYIINIKNIKKEF